MDDATYNIRVYRIEVYKGARVTSYRVRWKAGHRLWQRRELKHRPPGETRPVPVHPELVALLSQHLKEYTPGPDGRIFTGPRGGIFNDRAYLKVFHKARAAAFTPAKPHRSWLGAPTTCGTRRSPPG